MAGAVERFLEAASVRGLTIEPRRYPEGTRTAEDAARAIGCDVAQIVKSLVFVADGDAVLVLTSGANRVDTARLAVALGAITVRKADADEAREATGYAIGGTPPFGHTAPVRTVVDVDLLQHDRVYAAAGAPDTNFGITPDELRRVTGAPTVDIAER